MSQAQRGLSRVRRPMVGLLITLAACAVLTGWLPVPIFDTLDRQMLDTRMRATPQAFDDRIVIVDIDESSLAAQGRWPWPRQTLAELSRRLTDEGGATTVGFDVVLAEPDRDAAQDDAMATAMRHRPVILGYYFTSDRGARASGSLPAPVMRAAAAAQSGHFATAWTGYGANAPALQAAAAGAGYFNPIIDVDGKVRSLPLLAEYQGGLHESFSVAVLRNYLGAASLQLSEDHLILQGSRGSARLPLSTGLTALVPFAGGRPMGEAAAPTRFRYLSAADVLAGRWDPSLVRDRIVLVGTTAPGLTDLRATPLRAAFPGVEIHATMISGALDANPLAVRSYTEASSAMALLLTALAGLLLALGLPQMGAMGVGAVSLLAASGVWLAGAIAWSNFGLFVPTATGLVLVATLAVIELLAGYFIEGRARRAVAGIFGQYVSPELVDLMTRNPDKYGRVVSEDRELTVLFVDIRGFTRMAETMQPEPLREYINEFLSAMTDVVHRYGGTVDKYIGDAVMAFWGAPVDDPQHANHAVSAAQAMLDEVARLNIHFERRGLPLMRVGIGINTGIARVGDMGSRVRRAYTAIGDSVNLAARIEGLTRQFDVPVLVGASTREQATAHRFHDHGRAAVAGRSEPVRIFAPMTACDAVLPPKSAFARASARSEARADAATRIGS